MFQDEQSLAYHRLEALCLAHSEEALIEANKIIKDKHAAMDIVQDSIVQVLENWYKYDDTRLFWPWFKTIVKRMALNMLRKKKREVLTENHELMNLPFSLFSKESSTDLIIEEFWKTVHDLLTPKQSSMVSQRYQNDMEYQQIAESFDVSVGTVKRGLFDSHQKLRKVLDKNA
ncbi:sigma-70 family RNA polymerase sigma factor [Niallia taxi]|nr:sigma-70 family RNA polymerase sigma factor [Niallia taxi]MDE5052469.1 sigma-70 family RNA polymerase sigma factor [Niallia taxi]